MEVDVAEFLEATLGRGITMRNLEAAREIRRLRLELAEMTERVLELETKLKRRKKRA